MTQEEINALRKKQREEYEKYLAYTQMAEDADDLKEYRIGDKWQGKATAALAEAERINKRLLYL